jgi:hypothetical protein
MTFQSSKEIKFAGWSRQDLQQKSMTRRKKLYNQRSRSNKPVMSQVEHLNPKKKSRETLVKIIFVQEIEDKFNNYNSF